MTPNATKSRCSAVCVRGEPFPLEGLCSTPPQELDSRYRLASGTLNPLGSRHNRHGSAQTGHQLALSCCRGAHLRQRWPDPTRASNESPTISRPNPCTELATRRIWQFDATDSASAWRWQRFHGLETGGPHAIRWTEFYAASTAGTANDNGEALTIEKSAENPRGACSQSMRCRLWGHMLHDATAGLVLEPSTAEIQRVGAVIDSRRR